MKYGNDNQQASTVTNQVEKEGKVSIWGPKVWKAIKCIITVARLVWWVVTLGEDIASWAYSIGKEIVSFFRSSDE